VRGSVYRSVVGNPLPVLVEAGAEAITSGLGTALVRVPLTALPPMPSVLFFVVTDVVPPPGGMPYARAFSTEVFDSTVY